MPMDGLMLGFVARELNEKLLGGRIDKITQPEKDALVMVIRAGSENHRLLLCASPNNARAHLTAGTFSNPLEPPMFCMLLRKQLLGGRVMAVKQIGGDRILHIDMDVVDDLGDHVPRRLVLEIMGRHSNLILLDGDDRILEAARHVNMEMSRVRQIQPGMTYLPPPPQDKLAPEEVAADALAERIAAQGDIPLFKALAASVSGLSMPSARELAYRVLTPGCDRTEDIPAAADKLADFFARLPEMVSPRVLRDDNGDALDVFPFPYLTFDTAHQEQAGTVSDALDRYFGSRDRQDRINQRSASMVRLLKGQIDRCEKKLALQEEELASADRMEEYRIMGELINANLYQLKKGQTEAQLYNYYDENGGTMTVPLDVRLSPAQNAQKYFKKYQKARSARQTAAEQKEKTLKELNYLESMLLDVGKCVGESELEEIRQELVRTGYMKRTTNRRQQRALPQSKPYRYVSSDGIDILVGKNAVQNDRLTTGARPNEMWLHAKDMPGSHVIIRCEENIPEQTLKEAAILAAWYSKGQRSSMVPIDYTLRRYVKKPSGAAPGFVIYTNQHTAYMTVEESDVRAIRQVEA
ncbi:MAG: NFACT RNA binding domain-containing protein [Clostridia bacterium]|nr:NFACT RNA binding domain-containing protein [Clostridia bacterium]